MANAESSVPPNKDGNLAFWLASIYFIVLLFAQSNWSFVYYMYIDRSLAIQKRHPRLTLIASFFIIMMAVAIFFIGLYSNSTCCPPPSSNWREAAFIPAELCAICSLMIHVMRMYLSCFDLHYSQAMEDDKWRSIINPNDSNRNWFVRHKSHWIWGNTLSAFKIFYISLFPILVTFFITFELIVDGTFSLTVRLFLAVAGAIPCFHFCLLLVFIPKFKDSFYIREEMYYLAIGYIVAIFPWLLVVIFARPEPGTVFYPFYLIFTCQQPAIQNQLSIVFVLWRLKLPLWFWEVVRCRCNYRRTSNTNHMIEIQLREPRTIQPNSEKTIGTSFTIKDVFQSESGLSSFSRHLCKEFCTENLFWLIESEQFVENVCKQLEKEGEIFDKDSIFRIQFDPSVPKSALLEENSNNLIKQCLLLFEKYVKVGSSFEINLSFDRRYRVYSILHFKDGFYNLHSNTITTSTTITAVTTAITANNNNNNNNNNHRIESENVNWLRRLGSSIDIRHTRNTQIACDSLSQELRTMDLFRIYDDCRKEIYRLIGNSYSRFTATPEYAEWAYQQKQHLAQVSTDSINQPLIKKLIPK